MNAVLLSLTARHLLGRRRTIIMALLALLPVGIALLYRLTGGADSDDPPETFAPDFLNAIMLTGVLPLVALVFGTAALGAEIEDGTAVYLLSKPLSRWRIVAAKAIVASAATAALTVPTTIICGVIIFAGLDSDGIVLGLAAAVLVGSIVYSTVFVAASAITSRALIGGMAYVFVWEAFLTDRFAGLRWISVREYMAGVADLVASVPGDVFEAKLGGVAAIIAAVIVTAIAYVLGSMALDRFEIGERA